MTETVDLGNGIRATKIGAHLVKLARSVDGRDTDVILMSRENLRRFQIFMLGNTVEEEVKRQCEMVGGHLGTERE
jgi:hypothetical protein